MQLFCVKNGNYGSNFLRPCTPLVTMTHKVTPDKSPVVTDRRLDRARPSILCRIRPSIYICYGVDGRGFAWHFSLPDIRRCSVTKYIRHKFITTRGSALLPRHCLFQTFWNDYHDIYYTNHTPHFVQLAYINHKLCIFFKKSEFSTNLVQDCFYNPHVA